ncbi:hypothetical protein [Bryobacter aggregatus]|uniref:hypothetical protein n=1 Tax=Bryobacter aggregatus TaxID=360054 RepID=UPI00068C1A26|nr:hypothetical protein [Bryobacter aggregatus]
MTYTEIADAIQMHPHYRSWQTSLEMYKDLYSGGAQMKAKASNYLYRRHREPAEIYHERVSRAFYENYLGSIIDWYASTLFRHEPILTVEDTSRRSSKYYFEFFEDCDRNGVGITDFLRRRFTDALIFGRSFTALEFPKRETSFSSRLEEEAIGADRGYLTAIHPSDVVNWSYNTEGKLTLLTVRLQGPSYASIFQPTNESSRYLIYTETEYIIVELDGTDEKLQVKERGPHACASEERLPVFDITLSDGLWLMNKAAHLQLEHYNKSNSLAWSLGMALYATPVIYSKRDWRETLGESYYIHLDPEDKFGWTEPEGNVYRIAIENLNRLQEEIYRTCYVMGQSRSWLSGAAQVSGSSKRADYQITQEVLRAYGDSVKDMLKRLLQTLIRVRKDDLRISVSGLDEFEVGEFNEELDEAQKLFNMGLNSKTFRKQAYKKLAFKFLADINETTKERIASEIEEQIDKTS